MIDAFIADLAQRLEVSRRLRRRILSEVRDHLEDAAAGLQRHGSDPGAAREQACNGETERGSGVAGLGEHLISALQRRPLVACCTVATIAALCAVSHAETTVVGALPWAGTEVIAVFGGYLLLGPQLGLRAPGSYFGAR